MPRPATRGAALGAALLAALLPRARAYGLYGWPHRAYGWPHDGLGAWPEQRCPPYAPMAASGWGRGRPGELRATLTLPGVSASMRRVWLGDDGSTLFVRAARPLPAAGARCLPRSARLSGDGAHEVFDAALPLPPGAEAAGAALRPLRGGALELTVPWAPRPPRGAPEAPRPAQAMPPRPAQAGPAAPAVRSRPSEAAPSSTPAQAWRDEGVEVVEEDYPWPEKPADAAEGWWDNRGNFQYY